ncbi:MAG TPA: AIR synthase-related protein [Casimicrobium huifangae]|jgi:phosphoribosylformylglycinamidine cyclo-ligase|uniref:AIR synthase-related protein n=1 Tax=Casimicrobium huifangae TaxID=2591109 RepID=UPI002C8EDD7F|nr:AIR synthase-related protein [Casimicrobium huifangae]HQD66673.1 AIR synthase-related protein [Casimicrobium huifangae]
MSTPAAPSATNPNPDTLTYEQAGVNYDQVDPVKLLAQQSARATAVQLAQHGVSEIAASRGESAYVVDAGPFFLASIVECLGTKILVADAVYRETGKSFYGAIAQDTIAMAVNDLITVGATPLVVQAYWAAGGSDWFADRQRASDLIAGWKAACDVCGVSWGGGETPALAGVVEGGTIDLGASCTGIVQPKSRLSLGDKLAAGDAIVLLASSGIHANGVSLARKLAERLPQGYQTDVGNGQRFGEAILAPTVLYVPVTEALARAGVDVHYCVNVTGHGWRKLLRHPSALTYRIHTVPPVPPVLAFMQREAKLDNTEAYGTLNMGAGFAFFVRPDQAEQTVAIAKACGVDAWVAGQVEAGPKQAIIEPIGVTYSADDLKLR